MSPEAEYLKLFLFLAALYNTAAQRHNPLLDDPLTAPRPIEDSSPLSRQTSRLRQSPLSLLDDPLLDTVTSLGRQSLLDELLSAGLHIILIFSENF